MNNYIDLELRPDARGEVWVKCLRCPHEFRIPLESIKLREMITCPVSRDRFQFSEKCLSRQDKARAEKMVSDWYNKNKPTIRIKW